MLSAIARSPGARPLSAITTPVARLGMVICFGLAPFDHMSSWFAMPTCESFTAPTTVTGLVVSSMKIAAADVGSGFGTAIGSVPFVWPT